ncbi:MULTISPECIES: hypothetical protein [Bacillus]|uniref:hypothetical protein n=1 Tax=Bacillus TaxID=1386 RepID=UPI001F568BB2|nr:hypothetical protein [Bacillus thuringiensis]MCU5539058.1 hypothetical protein [Bacillus cereus]
MSLGYFNEKENVRKRQPHKRKADRITKENAVERLFERFLEVKVKQNLRPKSLNQFVLMFNSIKAFHNEKSTKAFYLSDITTNFISDWVGWLKNEYVRYDGHAYMPKTSQTVGSCIPQETEANLNGNVICFCMMKDWTKP